MKITPWILAGTLFSTTACQKTVHFTIDAAGDIKPISPFIYGVNQFDVAQPLAGQFQNATLLRIGGNRWTAYNWTNNASNAGSDWRFENDGYLYRGNDAGGAVAQRLRIASDHNAAAIVTIPINGYVAADKNGDGDVRQSGDNYLVTRFHEESPRKNAPFTFTPNPRDLIVYQDEFVNWLKVQFPYALIDPHRSIFFSLDNEPDLWPSTHLVVHPAPPTYDEMVQKTIDYASAIKDVMPSATIFAPVSYGWQGFVRLQNAPDADGRDFQEFFLDEMRKVEIDRNRRLLDVLDVHWYPEVYADGHRIIDAVESAALAQARIQAPRSLWDPTYLENSWIVTKSLNAPIALLPRLHRKIADHYPGTKLAVTEYNYGGANDISGAIAQADVLGIFGRQHIFAACEWPLAKSEPFISAGFQMYRNFDGANGHFGDLSLSAQTENAEISSIYASRDSAHPGQVILIAINKTDKPLTADIQLLHAGNFQEAQVFCLTAREPSPKAAKPILLKNAAHFSYPMPPMSVTTLRLTTAASIASSVQ